MSSLNNELLRGAGSVSSIVRERPFLTLEARFWGRGTDTDAAYTTASVPEVKLMKAKVLWRLEERAVTSDGKSTSEKTFQEMTVECRSREELEAELEQQDVGPV